LGYPSYEDVKQAREVLKEVSTSHWLSHDLLSWQWWLLLAATIVPWIIWLKVRDKDRTFEIFSYGLTWGMISSVLDVIGGEMIFWGYPNKLLPMVPPLFPADITVIPVSYMLTYQYSKTYKSYLGYCLIVSAMFAYVLEPLFIKSGMFILHKWKHTYSFIGFFILSQLIYWMINKLTPTKSMK
jgi:hypothetical protein